MQPWTAVSANPGGVRRLWLGAQTADTAKTFTAVLEFCFAWNKTVLFLFYFNCADSFTVYTVLY